MSRYVQCTELRRAGCNFVRTVASHDSITPSKTRRSRPSTHPKSDSLVATLLPPPNRRPSSRIDINPSQPHPSMIAREMAASLLLAAAFLLPLTAADSSASAAAPLNLLHVSLVDLQVRSLSHPPACARRYLRASLLVALQRIDGILRSGPGNGCVLLFRYTLAGQLGS